MPKGKKRSISELIAEQESIVSKKKEDYEKAQAELDNMRNTEKMELLDKAIQIAKEKNISVEELLNKVK